ncbi:LLM class flavin-dependent oxidoreductase [Umezawaea endophytica]|uniref:LLM class flavin-dependent oxidoreductase n=1 Tax=Umezawaea endophytica TaxID=1654476 RepID=A0A9X2VKN7_9PSEU|nr:LLM class flavin-dependent oxidoreductase [Umezawaea endophytica]MCS7477817.1 LLM class flavin-dependent oxidoreductase [Umezawaea endophytica]
MKFGLWLTAQHPESVTAAEAVAQHLEQVRTAAELGFDLALAGQHFLPQPYWMLQNVPLLARVAAEAGPMRLGTGISLLTLLNPVELAETVATMDALTSGRFVLGVGQGYRTVEDDAFGITARRGRLFEEKVRIVRDLLSGARVTADGPGYRLREAQLALPAPSVPLWIAANSDAGVRRAARLGDTWLLNPHSDLVQLARQVDLYHRERAAAGRPSTEDLPAAREVCVRPTTQEALDVARPHVEAKYAAYVSWGQDATMPSGDTLRRDWPDLVADGRFIIGSPEDCVARIVEHVDRLGVTELVCRFQWPGTPQHEVLRSMRLFAAEVVPAVEEALRG